MSEFTCPRANCNRPVGNHYGPCPACAAELRANADTRHREWLDRRSEILRVAGHEAVTCPACEWEYVPDPDDPYVNRCPLCGGEGKAA
jgi:hypothetical protein